MGNFQRDDNRGGGFRGGNSGGRPAMDRRDRPNFGNKSFGGGRGDRGPVTMHKAVCDECHKNCEVPFRPSGDKPIYCNDCFNSKRSNDDRGPRRDFGDRPAPSFSKPAPVSDEVKKQLSEISSKLDRLVIAIEKLTLPVVKKVDMPAHAGVKTPVKKVVIKKKK